MGRYADTATDKKKALDHYNQGLLKMLGGNRSLEKRLKTAIWQRLYNKKNICYRQSYRQHRKLLP
jgi:hypothetical protein